jgi:hypothetical protein
MNCKICAVPIPMKRPGQRFCSVKCRNTGFRRKSAKKQGMASRVTLHPTGVPDGVTETGKKPLYNNGDFGPPTYYYTVAGTNPLSEVEIAALGGFVVSMLR